MRIYFYETKNESRCGTNMLLKHLLRKENIEVVTDPVLCDFVFVSLYDITVFDRLYKAKQLFKQPIVCGGDVAKLDIVLNYADYIVRGEAYNFIEELGKLKNNEDIINIPNVWTSNKKGTIDYKIKYSKNPIIKASPKTYYYYGGKGCPQKCKYCFYSHNNEYSQIPKDYVIKALKKIPKSGKLYLTSAYFPYPEINDYLLKKLGMIDLKNSHYLKKRFPCRSFRMGIEFFTEGKRKQMGKPIKNEKITETVNKSLEWKHEIVMYMMAGLEQQEDMYQFISLFPEYHKTYSPRITIHFQYIDFNENTPLENINVTQRYDFDTKLLQKEFNLKNRRVRVGPIKYKAFSTYRTLLQRTKTKDETEFIYSMRNEKNNDTMINKTINKFPHLIGNKKNIYIN